MARIGNRGRLFALVAAVLLGAIFGLHRIADPDLFQQIAVGNEVLSDAGSIGLSTFHDRFPDYPFVADKWLASVAVAVVERFGAGDGLMLYQVLLNVLLAIAWMRLYRTVGGSPAASLAGTALTFVACAFRTDPRPDTLSMIMLALVASLFTGGVAMRKLRLLFPLAMAVWVNLHGYFVTGLMVAATASLATWCGDRRWSPATSAGNAVIALSGAVACCIHPQGWHALAWPFRQLLLLLGDSSPLREAILEFQPTTSLLSGMGWWRWALLAITPLAAVSLDRLFRREAVTSRLISSLVAAAPWLLIPPQGLSLWPYRLTMALAVMALFELPALARDRRILEVLLFAGAVVMAVPVLRNLSLVPPAALMILVPAWTAAEGVGRPVTGAVAGKNSRGKVLAAMAVLLLVTAGWARLADRLAPGHYRSPEWTGWGVDRRTLPVAAAGFILEHDLPGPILNHFDNGGYLLYRLHPERKVLIAGNTSMYPEEFLGRYRRGIARGDLSFGGADRKNGFRTAVISHAAMETSNLVRALAASDRWALVFLDSSSAVYLYGVPGDEAAPPVIDVDLRYEELRSAAADTSPLPGFMSPRPRLYPSLNLAAFLRNAGRPDLALQEVERLLPLGLTPELAALGAGAAEDSGRLPGYVHRLEEALAAYPSSELVRTWLSRALFARGVTAMEGGRIDAAEADLWRSKRLNPGEVGPVLALARIEGMRGNEEAATRLLGEAIRLGGQQSVGEAIRRDPILAPLAP